MVGCWARADQVLQNACMNVATAAVRPMGGTWPAPAPRRGASDRQVRRSNFHGFARYAQRYLLAWTGFLLVRLLRGSNWTAPKLTCVTGGLWPHPGDNLPSGSQGRTVYEGTVQRPRQKPDLAAGARKSACLLSSLVHRTESSRAGQLLTSLPGRTGSGSQWEMQQREQRVPPRLWTAMTAKLNFLE